MKVIDNFLSSLDSFGKTFDLTFDHKKQYRSSAGGIFTILTYLLVLSTIWIFGKELIYKVKPILVTQIQASAARPNLTLKLNTAFTIEDRLGVYIPDYSKYVTINAFKTNITWSLPGGLGVPLINITNIAGNLCTPQNFSGDLQSGFSSNNLNFAQCFNLSHQLGGYQNTIYLVYLTVELTRCKNSTSYTDIQSVSQTCASNYEIDTFLKRSDIQMTAYYEQISFDPKNHLIPVTKYLGEDYFAIDPEVCKVNEFFFQEFIINDDDEWLFSNNITNVFQQIDYKKKSFYFKGNNSDTCLIKNNIFASEFTTTNHRTYIKVVDVMAQLGGILKIIFLGLDVILAYLYSRKMNESIINNIFKINLTDLDQDKELDDKSPKIKLIIDNTEQLDKNSINKSNIINNSNEILVKNEQIDEFDTLPISDNRDFEFELSKSINLAESQRNVMIKNLDEKFEFSLMEHFSSTFFPCCSSVNLKKKENIYGLLLDHVNDYTDIVNFAKTICEVDKLKFVLFNSKQLALFNLISPPENPLNPDLKKRISVLFKYSKDNDAQIKQAKKYLKRCQDSSKMTDLDKKLLDMFL